MRILLLLLFCLSSTALVAATAPDSGLDPGMVNPGHHDKPVWFKDSFLDIREDMAEAQETGKRLLLYFYQDGCPYCARLLQENFADRDVVSKTRQNFDVIALNIWGDREVTGLQGQAVTEKVLAASLKVQFTPTLLFLDESGKVVLRINGYFPPHKFAVALDYVAGRYEARQKFRDYYAGVAPVPASGKFYQQAAALPLPLQLGDNRKTSHRPLLVLFEQRRCAACDELHQDGLRRRELAAALSNFDLAQVDIWSSDLLQTPDGRSLSARDWAKELGIQYAPSLLFFDATGKEVFRAEAYLKSFHLHAALDYVATGAYLHQPNFQRFVQHRADSLRAMGFEIDLMK